MKISFEREPFLSSFQTAATIAPSRSPKPILSNIKLEANGENSILTATDMEVGVRLTIKGVEVEAPGSVILPVQRFGSLLRESADEKLVIETDDRGTTVTGNTSKFKLPGENPDEFPSVATFDEKDYIELKSTDLKRLIRRTLFATDTESSRYALGGILLEISDDKLIGVGTDGRRLAKMEVPASIVGKGKSGDSMTIVPSKSMQLIERTLADSDDTVQISARANDVLFKIPAGTIYSRLVEGRFPKWEDVFPTRTESMKLTTPVGPLYSALRQAAIVASEESRGIDFAFGDGTLVLSSNTAEVGESHVEMPIEYAGEKIEIRLDHTFFGEFLKVLSPEETFVLDVEGHESAATCSTEDGYGYVIMPLSRERG